MAALGLALLATSACENLTGPGNNTTPDGRSTTSGGSTLGSRGSYGPATGAPGTGPGAGSGVDDAERGATTSPSSGDMTRPGSIPGEGMLN
jgi:hypothetical protein